MDNNALSIGFEEYKSKLAKAFQSFEINNIVFHEAVAEDKGRGKLYYPVLVEFDSEPYNTWKTFCQLYAIKENLPSIAARTMLGFVLLVVDDSIVDHRMHPWYGDGEIPSEAIFTDIEGELVKQRRGKFYQIPYSSQKINLFEGCAFEPQWELACGQYGDNDEFFVHFLKAHVADLTQPKQIKLFEYLRNRFITRPILSRSIFDEPDNIKTYLNGTSVDYVEKNSARGNIRRYDWDKHTLSVLQQFIGEFKSEDELFLLGNLKSFCGASQLEVANSGDFSFHLNWNEKDLKKLYEYLYDYGYVNKELTTWGVFLYYMNGVGRKPQDKIIWERSAYDFYAFIECIVGKEHSRPWKTINNIFSVPSSKSPIGNTGYQNAYNSANHDLNIKGFEPFMK